jgi:hypothetical protein
MRIFESVASGKPIVNPAYEPLHPKSVADLRKRANTSIRIVSDEAAQYYFYSPRDDWSVNSGTFGKIMPPFADMWLEVVTPTRAYINKQWVSARKVRYAFIFCKESESIWQVYFLATRLKHGPVMAFPAMARIVINDDNSVEESLSYDKDAIPEALALSLSENLSIAYLALGWMNSRNVELVDQREPLSRRRKRQRTSDLPSLEYKKIIIDGKSRRSLKSNQEAERRHQRLHVVRGHFKTYTADRPLMGKFVGQYWWHQQTRGETDLGVIHHEYEVKQGAVR